MPMSGARKIGAALFALVAVILLSPVILYLLPVILGFVLGIGQFLTIFIVLFAVGTLAWFSYRFFWRGVLKRYYRLWRMERRRMKRLMKERMQEVD